jgi:hypothetical protein
LREAVLASRFGHRDLTLEHVEDDGCFTLRGPPLELFPARAPTVELVAIVVSLNTFISLIRCPAPEGITSVSTSASRFRRRSWSRVTIGREIDENAHAAPDSERVQLRSLGFALLLELARNPGERFEPQAATEGML